MRAAPHALDPRWFAPAVWAAVWFVLHAVGDEATPWYPAAALTFALAVTHGWRAVLLPLALSPLHALVIGATAADVATAAAIGGIAAVGYGTGGVLVARALGPRRDELPPKPVLAQCVGLVAAAVAVVAIAEATTLVLVDQLTTGPRAWDELPLHALDEVTGQGVAVLTLGPAAGWLAANPRRAGQLLRPDTGRHALGPDAWWAPLSLLCAGLVVGPFPSSAWVIVVPLVWAALTAGARGALVANAAAAVGLSAGLAAIGPSAADARKIVVDLGMAAAIALAFGGLVRDRRRHTEALERRARQLVSGSEALAVEKERYRRVVESLAEALVVVDGHGTIEETNAAAVALAGRSGAQLRGRSLLEILPPPPDRDPADWLAELLSQPDAGRSPDGRRSAEAVGAGGACVPVSISLARVDIDGRDRYTLILSDESERRAHQRELERLAMHDALTGLPNRALFSDRFGRALARARRGGTTVAVLVLDLDGFKEVNDTFGHEAGDKLLVAVAERFDRAARDADTVARIGGDEFVVLLEATDATLAAEMVARRLLASVAEPIVLEAAMVTIGVSIGASTGDGWLDQAAVLREADSALYRAKEAGRNCYRLAGADGEDAEADEELGRAIALGLERGEFQLEYLPIVRLDRGRIVGVEALVRWDRPGHGRLLPEAFLDEAERCGHAIRLGEHVLRTACRDVARLSMTGVDLNLTVNLSSRQLNSSVLVATVRGALEESGLPARRLMLDVSEASVGTGVTEAVRSLGRIRQSGVRVALDDFGTGYSPLTAIKSMPIDALKIDEEFTQDLDADPSNRAVVSAVLAIARELGREVIAEGVEREEDAHALRRLGVVYAQGRLFGRPEQLSTIGRRLRPALA